MHLTFTSSGARGFLNGYLTAILSDLTHFETPCLFSAATRKIYSLFIFNFLTLKTGLTIVAAHSVHDSASGSSM